MQFFFKAKFFVIFFELYGDDGPVSNQNSQQESGGEVYNGREIKTKIFANIFTKAFERMLLGSHSTSYRAPGLCVVQGIRNPTPAWKWCVVSVTDNWAKVEAKMFRFEFGYR